MADATDNTPSRDPKDHSTTTILSAFPAFLRLFRAAIDAEMRIDHSDVDPMSQHFANDLHHAETLRERLIESCFDILDHIPEIPADKGLVRLAFLLKTLFETTDDDDKQHVFARVRDHQDIFLTDPSKHRIFRMQTEFFSVFSDMAELREFGGPGHEPPMLDPAMPIPA